MILHKGKFLNLIGEGHWEFVARTNCAGVVVIVPITDDQKIILVEQYRIPLKANVIELPAGLVGDTESSSKESLEEGAKRELLEETGYQALQMNFLTNGPPSAGLCSEIATFFKATFLKKIGPGGGDETESITVHEVPLNEIDRWLEQVQKKRKFVDPKVYAGLYFLYK